MYMKKINKIINKIKNKINENILDKRVCQNSWQRLKHHNPCCSFSFVSMCKLFQKLNVLFCVYFPGLIVIIAVRILSWFHYFPYHFSRYISIRTPKTNKNSVSQTSWFRKICIRLHNRHRNVKKFNLLSVLFT